MALRVWLPLNGSLENKGISGPVTQTTAPTYVDGKIGKAMSTGAFYIPAAEAAKFYNNEAMSFCFWIYPIGAENSGIILGQSAMAAGDNRMFSIFQYPTPNDLHLSWQIETATNTTFFSCIINGIFTANVWTHCAITYNGSQVLVYKNGTLSNTYSCSKSTRSNFSYNVPVPSLSIRYLNDLRIYDHALSPLEVKEISQGLILHYKLDGFEGGPNRNIALKSNNGNFGSSNELLTKTFTGWDNYAQYDLNLTADQWNAMVGQKVTYSCWLNNIEQTVGTGTGIMIHFRYADGTYTQFGGGKNGSTGQYFTQGESGWAKLTVTVPDPTTRKNPTTITRVQYSVRHNSTDGSGTVAYQYAKVELGDTQTQWSWAPEDMGIDMTKVTDSSGYGNDGTIYGSLSVKNQDTRYNKATFFNNGTATAGSNYILTPAGSFNWFDFGQSTITAWICPTEGKSGWGGTIGVAHDGTNASKAWSISNYGNKLTGHTTNNAWVNNQSTGSLPVNEWHFIAGTLDGTTQKLYLDGELVKTSTITWPASPTPRTDYRFQCGVDMPGTNETFTGYYSDVRFYVTALSAEDILDLYHTPANIDNLNRLHTFELNETFEKELIKDFSRLGVTGYTTGSAKCTEEGVVYTGKVWAPNGYIASDYIPIKNSGYTYYYDITYSNTGGGMFYIGFERFDANKTATSNSSCVYPVGETTERNYYRKTGTVNFSTDANGNPVKYIRVRILTDWNNSARDDTRVAKIHHLSVKEVPNTNHNELKIYENGIYEGDEIFELNENISRIKNTGLSEYNGFIEK